MHDSAPHPPSLAIAPLGHPLPASGARERGCLTAPPNSLIVTMTEPTWSLHPQLAADTVAVGDLALSRLLLASDANYPWLILVPRKGGLVEIVDLEENGQVQLMAEVTACARARPSGDPNTGRARVSAICSQVQALSR